MKRGVKNDCSLQFASHRFEIVVLKLQLPISKIFVWNGSQLRDHVCENELCKVNDFIQ
jgi:hypothetical protein